MNTMAAIYCRESTDKQDIESLVAMCERQALELGIKEYRVYKDIKSGYSAEREEYIKLINDIKAGEIKTVIVYESSRLGRDELEHHILYKIFRNYDVKVYNMTRGWVDPANEDDLFLEGIINLLDAREGRKIARRIKDRLKELCMSGQWTGGKAPFGYNLENKELIINNEEAQIVRDIFNLYIEGYTKAKIAKIYNFEIKRIKRILTNPVYIGKLKFRQFQKDKNNKRIELKDYEVFNGKHQAIISEDIFNIANRKIKVTHREKISQPSIFRNLLYCNCGNKLYRHENSYAVYYSCKNNCINQIKEEALLNDIIKKIENILNELDLNKIENKNKKIIERIELYKKQEKSYEIQIENLTRKFIASQIKEELYDKLSKEINEKNNILKIELEELNKKLRSQSNSKNNKEIILKYLEKIKIEDDKDKLNQFLLLIIDKVIFINSYRYKIYLKI